MIGEDKQLAGRVLVHSMEVGSPTIITHGDVVVLGNRVDAQRLSIERGASLVVISNSSTPAEEILELARERGTAIIVSAARHVRHGAHDHARGTLSRADGREPADGVPMT